MGSRRSIRACDVIVYIFRPYTKFYASSSLRIILDKLLSNVQQQTSVHAVDVINTMACLTSLTSRASSNTAISHSCFQNQQQFIFTVAMSESSTRIPWQSIPSSTATCKVHLIQAGGLHIPTDMVLLPGPDKPQDSEDFNDES